MASQLWEKILGKLIKESNPANKSVFEDNLPAISTVAEDVVDILSDGFQIEDIAGFCKVVGPIMEMAKDISDLSKKEKEQFVVDTVWMIFHAVDTYPDGEGNRINVPILFGGLERKFEKKMVDLATRSAVKAIYEFGKSKGYF